MLICLAVCRWKPQCVFSCLLCSLKYPWYSSDCGAAGTPTLMECLVESGRDASLSHCAAIVWLLFSSLAALASSTWHSEPFRPLHVSLALTHTHHHAAQHCVWSFDVRTKAWQCVYCCQMYERLLHALLLCILEMERKSESTELNFRV